MTMSAKGGKPIGLPKSGGRVKGTPNKATQDVAEKLAALGCDPLAGLATIAMDGKNSAELRARSYSDLLHYLYPKRKRVDITIQQPTVVNVTTTLDSAPSDPDTENKLAPRDPDAGNKSDSEP
jgi:hypothetical protein